jgi:hypothetical protein
MESVLKQRALGNIEFVILVAAGTKMRILAALTKS